MHGWRAQRKWQSLILLQQHAGDVQITEGFWETLVLTASAKESDEQHAGGQIREGNNSFVPIILVPAWEGLPGGGSTTTQDSRSSVQGHKHTGGNSENTA